MTELDKISTLIGILIQQKDKGKDIKIIKEKRKEVIQNNHIIFGHLSKLTISKGYKGNAD